MREYRSYGSVRGALSNERPYREIIGSSAARTSKTYRRPDMKLLRLAESAEIRGDILRKLYCECYCVCSARPYNLRIRCVEWLGTSTN